MSGDDKKIDIEMLIFFMGVSVFSFSFYLFRHPIFYVPTMSVDRKAILSVYMPDFIIFISALLPYLGVLGVLILRSLFFGKIVRDKYFLMLFFPLLAFFSKGMYLPEVYIDYRPLTLIKDNFGFFSFIILGFILNGLQNKLRKLHGNTRE